MESKYVLSKEEFIANEGRSFPGKTYVENLLKPVFYDQRDYLFEVMFEIHRAHVLMLLEQGILEKEEAAKILKGVEEVAKMNDQELEYDPHFEDLFFMIEAKIADTIGADLAGKIHIARSRNDMGVAMYRMVLREYILGLIKDTTLLLSALLEKAEEHKHTIMPAYTHTQPAQPSTLGHYLTAVHDVIERDLKRLWHAYHTVNRSPMGAAAITTTGFPINRDRVRELLGFDELVENSYDAIGGGDYLLESSTSLLTLMVDVGRFVQDMLQYSTREFGTIRVADPYIQISSIMPQKRNPVSFEHSRSLSSSAVGEAMAVIQMIHNTPYGDIVDTEDDLQPHLYRGYEIGSRVMRILYSVVRTMEVDQEKLRQRAKEACITITELADVLTRDHGVSFRKAHHVAARISKKVIAEKKELFELALDEVNQIIKEKVGVTLTEQNWEEIVSPESFVEKRKIQGGPNPDEVARMIEVRIDKWKQYEQQLENIWDGLQESKKKLQSTVFHVIQKGGLSS
ncbi:argininosuccinate lyase [Tepidibacillus decaturensis]|uniref:Argininosuccinate lyase n=1 Tax=Tepidibacillus decaturensis TaxID=1413211 RepID=A0A135L6F0_9BACI|nr:argininosuccinate lyase [Tepidibacillus decaturensis]KXG44575.1 argininosuccinate lyase [Tepidibacillus decaturensis]